MPTNDHTARSHLPDIEVPEADAAEQAMPADDAGPPSTPALDLEVPEADALEQAAEWPSDADDEYEHTLGGDTDEE